MCLDMKNTLKQEGNGDFLDKKCERSESEEKMECRLREVYHSNGERS